jgi:uncharacterized membrane protein (UPF0127 family)
MGSRAIHARHGACGSLLSVLVALLLSGVLPARAAGPQHETVWVTFPDHEVRLVAELVDTRAERYRGLAGRDGLAEGHGMLFVYEHEKQIGIWMKGMRFPIDILWFDRNYRLVSAARNVEPGSYPAVYRPDEPARYVLEVGAGFLAQHNIVPGDRIVVSQALPNRESTTISP